jgi:hypothetical protein
MPNSINFIILTSYGRKRLLFLAMVISLTSCSHGVFSIPPAVFTYYENSLGTGRAIRIENTGLIVDTNADIGITLGHSNKTYFFEGQNSRRFFGNSIETILDNSARQLSTDISQYRLMEKNISLPEWQMGAAAAFSAASEGLVLSTGKYRLGLTLGLNRYARLMLPYQFDGIVYINTGMDSAKRSIFSVESTP